jgi:hypothetical protein
MHTSACGTVVLFAAVAIGDLPLIVLVISRPRVASSTGGF